MATSQSASAAKHLAHVQRIVEGGGLIAEHDIIGPRNAHDIVAAGHAEQRQQRIHIVLVGLGVVGVAHIHAHRQTQELAAKVVFEGRPDNLLAIVEVLGADEADHRIDEQRPEAPGHGVGAGLAGLLVEAVVGIGRERATLAGFEVHHILPQRAAAQAERGFVGLLQQA
nr:hypothetical protein [Tanacetum cinerariifolium]